jgi:DNA polymerase III subunit epsilon
MRAAAAEQCFERAIWLRRRAGRLRAIFKRLGGVLEATHARPRLIVAAHPVAPRHDFFWLAGGRLVDWGAVGDLDELVSRTAAALRRGGRVGELGAHVPPHEVDELRIVASYLASHPDTRQLALDPMPRIDALAEELDLPGSRSGSGEGELDDARADPVRAHAHA